MIVVITFGLLFIQIVCRELFEAQAHPLQLWLLPVVGLALSSKKIRVFPIVLLGLLMDGIYFSPTGFHVLEGCLVYGIFAYASEHLGHRSLSGRITLGIGVSFADVCVKALLALAFSYPNHIDMTFASLLWFAGSQSVAFAVLFPLVVSQIKRTDRSENRL